MTDHGFTMTAEEGGAPPDWPNFDGTTWTVTLSRKGHRYRTEFHQGSAHTEAPATRDVVSCVLSDMTGYANATSFEDWASEYGYDTDSRKAYSTFQAVEKQYHRMLPLVGNDDLFDLANEFQD